jgi:hypothetical protein
MSFRKEKKYRFTKYEFLEFKTYLTAKGLTALFEPRIISSVYFDTPNLRMFFESEEGTLPRKKIRVRSYDLKGKFTLEQKVSSVEGRFKTTNTPDNIFHESEIEDKVLFDKDYGQVTPSLTVTYQRSYYSLQSMRITCDQAIRYKSMRQNKNNLLCYDPENVIEIKIPNSLSDDYIEEIIPHPTSRFSKYSRGLLLFGHS